MLGKTQADERNDPRDSSKFSAKDGLPRGQMNQVERKVGQSGCEFVDTMLC